MHALYLSEICESQTVKLKTKRGARVGEVEGKLQLQFRHNKLPLYLGFVFTF